MKILVTGAGRGGTNLVTELIRGMNIVNFTDNVEDRSFFNKGLLLSKYATKLATENKGFTVNNIKEMMEKNPDLFIVFSVRNPIDNALSKIVRGQPKSKGGDAIGENKAPDGTLDGSIKAIKHMFNIYQFLIKNYPGRVLLVRMEELILFPEETTKKVCAYFNIEYNEKFLKFHKHNRNKYQQKRYGNNLVKNVNLYLDLNKNFNGFFKDRPKIVKRLTENLNEIIEAFQYGQIQ